MLGVAIGFDLAEVNDFWMALSLSAALSAFIRMS